MSERLAYLAGIVDGEGHIGIKRMAPKPGRRVTPGYHARVCVRMQDPQAIDFLHEEFGGRRCAHRPQVEGRRPMQEWSVLDAAAARALRALMPWLRVKREVAFLVLELRAIQATSSKHRTKVVGTRQFPNAHGTIRIVENRALSDEYVASLEQLRMQVRRLNRGREVV